MPNVMAALRIQVAPSVENDEERKFRIFFLATTPQSLADPAARVPFSNAANIEECKTWTQSEFCM